MPQLKISEYEFYRGTYCGLCRAMKKYTGGTSAATLSYDMVFFALLRAALTGEDYSVSRGRCALHPLKKRIIMKQNKALEYTARINAVLVYFKLLDDISDERGAKRAAAGALLPAAKRIKKRAALSTELEESIKRGLDTLTSLEKAKCPSPDEAADAFGKVLAEALCYGIEDEKNARLAYDIGLHTGRAVYLADAACDIFGDKKSGSYNPFLLAFDGEIGENETQMMRECVLLELSSLSRDIELIDFKNYDLTYGCVTNIAVFGIKNAFFAEYEKERMNEKSIHRARR